MLACTDLKDTRIGKESNVTCKQLKSRKILSECQLEMINETHMTIYISQCPLQEIAEFYLVKI